MLFQQTQMENAARFSAHKTTLAYFVAYVSVILINI